MIDRNTRIRSDLLKVRFTDHNGSRRTYYARLIGRIGKTLTFKRCNKDGLVRVAKVNGELTEEILVVHEDEIKITELDLLPFYGEYVERRWEDEI